jgi:hypothetical protein
MDLGCAQDLLWFGSPTFLLSGPAGYCEMRIVSVIQESDANPWLLSSDPHSNANIQILW